MTTPVIIAIGALCVTGATLYGANLDGANLYGALIPTEGEPAPVGGVGSVLDGNVTSVAAELVALPAGAAAVTRHGAVYQKRTNDTWVACGSNFCVSGRTVGAGAPLTVIWLPEAGDGESPRR